MGAVSLFCCSGRYRSTTSPFSLFAERCRHLFAFLLYGQAVPCRSSFARELDRHPHAPLSSRLAQWLGALSPVLSCLRCPVIIFARFRPREWEVMGECWSAILVLVRTTRRRLA